VVEFRVQVSWAPIAGSPRRNKVGTSDKKV
jgi:hypothetical protein